MIYTTLYVQSDDCKGSIHYRNISIVENNIWVESSEELEYTFDKLENNCNSIIARFL